MIMTVAKQQPKSKGEQDRQLTKELEMTFPTSDPLASTQPGGGITGAEVKATDPKPKSKDKPA
jgi:hypothetical protein